MKRGFSSSFDTKYLKHVGVCVLSAVLSATLLFILISHLTPSKLEGIKTVYAVPQTVEQSLVCDAYIIRNESVIEGTVSGALTPNASDGTRVRAGECVASVYSSPSPMTVSKLELVEDQIDFYEKCIENESSLGDTSATNRTLSSTVISIRRAVGSGDVSSALSLKSKAVLNIRRLGVLSGRVSDFSSVVASLNSTLSSLRASLGTVGASVYAPCAGYYYSECDGYEDIFSTDDVETLTFSGLSEMISAAEARDVDSSASCGKIVKDFRWYIACKMTAGESSQLSLQKKYSLSLENNEGTRLETKLCSLLTDGADTFALFSCDRVDGSLDMSRFQQATLVLSSTDCYTLPREALRIYDGVEGVFVLDELKVDFRRVSVIGGNDSLAYCELETAETEPTDESSGSSEYARLAQNDLVITAGTGLYVGMMLDIK